MHWECFSSCTKWRSGKMKPLYCVKTMSLKLFMTSQSRVAINFLYWEIIIAVVLANIKLTNIKPVNIKRVSI